MLLLIWAVSIDRMSNTEAMIFGRVLTHPNLPAILKHGANPSSAHTHLMVKSSGQHEYLSDSRHAVARAPIIYTICSSKLSAIYQRATSVS